MMWGVFLQNIRRNCCQQNKIAVSRIRVLKEAGNDRKRTGLFDGKNQ